MPHGPHHLSLPEHQDMVEEETMPWTLGEDPCSPVGQMVSAALNV